MKARTMRFLLLSLEADRQSGWPLWFLASFFAIRFFCLGALCLKRCSEVLLNSSRVRVTAAMVFRVLLWFSALGLHAQQPSQATSPQSPTSSWLPVGPAGGDARAFGSVPGDPTHLYLGTTNSWLYESTDAGAHWHRLAMIDDSGHLILDHIVVDAADPATIFVAAWKDGTGGLWTSHDRGKSFGEVMSLHDQSIRSFLQAPNNPKLLLAGTLQGVYRSTDEGATWSLISPPEAQRSTRSSRSPSILPIPM